MAATPTPEPSRSATASPAPRLTLDDWVEAGFATIAEQGARALKIDTLCRRLGVTKGSFYWHFSDMKTYRETLSEAWAEARDGDRNELDELGKLEPRDRLAAMMDMLTGPRHWTLERAMREWARTDPSVSSAVQASDRRVFLAVRKAFLDAGFPAKEADFRARLTFNSGIGFIHLSAPDPGVRAAQYRDQFVDFVLRP